MAIMKNVVVNTIMYVSLLMILLTWEYIPGDGIFTYRKYVLKIIKDDRLLSKGEVTINNLSNYAEKHIFLALLIVISILIFHF